MEFTSEQDTYKMTVNEDGDVYEEWIQDGGEV